MQSLKIQNFMRYRVLLLLAVPALLLESNDELLLKLLESVRDLARPVGLVQHLHLSAGCAPRHRACAEGQQ